MDTGEMTKKIKKLESSSLFKDVDNVVQGRLVLFGVPNEKQAINFSKDDRGSGTYTSEIVYDKKGRREDRMVEYKTIGRGMSNGVDVLQSREYLAIPNATEYSELRRTTYGDGRNSVIAFNSDILPIGNNRYNLGAENAKWEAIYAHTPTINTSDERCKTNICDPNDSLMKAWGKVRYVVFSYSDSLDDNDDGARLHTGVIAQQIIRAFSDEGLDALSYGLVCRESGSDGMYGVRYAEVFAIEAAYLRWRVEQVEQRLSVIEEYIM